MARSDTSCLAAAEVYRSTVLPLTSFGGMTFSSTSATIKGSTHSVSGFSYTIFAMWNVPGTAKIAVPGSLSNGGRPSG